jgi:hypothetical protein
MYFLLTERSYSHEGNFGVSTRAPAYCASFGDRRASAILDKDAAP